MVLIHDNCVFVCFATKKTSNNQQSVLAIVDEIVEICMTLEKSANFYCDAVVR